ncbi:MAG: PLP-dependent aminotransferase family protein [Parvibaculum sp.]|uniref:MocR-like pyridoxine biosynthesis transcription factor PdxR n=1 Tax=Parvibaculum sp. TaxID=2024848 RepID=UPI0032631103
MPASPLPLGTIALDSGAELPLYRQLYDALREAILEGRLHPGARLPSSRTLAGDLGVGRNTVLAAYDQLTAEGYLEGQVGAGTLVAATLPDSLLQLDRQASPRRAEPPASNARTLSKRGEALSASRRLAPAYKRGLGQPFQHGLPAIDEFPAMLWSRLLARHSRDTRNGHFGYEVGFGVPALREAIAAYAGAARGVVCSADQVIVTVGAQGALDLTARMLLDPGDPVWIEEPGYLGARGALAGAGAQLTPVPVDAEGIDVEAGIARQPSPKLIYVTPSHQFPLGATLSLPRRLALLEHARQSGAWILEDDYDSEYRYQGRPIPSLQGLDRAGTVIYMGTFAKTLFPALKIGYLIVPQNLVDAFATAIRITGHVPPSAVQAALADFIGEGHFGSHVRRMRALYSGRRACLIRALEGELSPWLNVAPGEGGLQLSAYLPDKTDDRAVAAAATQAGLFISPLALYRLEEGRPGLYMGYASVPEAALERAATRLAEILHSGNWPRFT